MDSFRVPHIARNPGKHCSLLNFSYVMFCLFKKKTTWRMYLLVYLSKCFRYIFRCIKRVTSRSKNKNQDSVLQNVYNVLPIILGQNYFIEHTDFLFCYHRQSLLITVIKVDLRLWFTSLYGDTFISNPFHRVHQHNTPCMGLCRYCFRSFNNDARTCIFIYLFLWRSEL